METIRRTDHSVRGGVNSILVKLHLRMIWLKRQLQTVHENMFIGEEHNPPEPIIKEYEELFEIYQNINASLK